MTKLTRLKIVVPTRVTEENKAMLQEIEKIALDSDPVIDDSQLRKARELAKRLHTSTWEDLPPEEAVKVIGIDYHAPADKDTRPAAECFQNPTRSQLDAIIKGYVANHNRLYINLIEKNKKKSKYNPAIAKLKIYKKSGAQSNQSLELNDSKAKENGSSDLRSELHELVAKYFKIDNRESPTAVNDLATIELAYREANLMVYKSYLERKIEATKILKSLDNNDKVKTYKKDHPGFALLQTKLDIVKELEEEFKFNTNTPKIRLQQYREKHKKYTPILNKHCLWAKDWSGAKALIGIFAAIYCFLTKTKSAFFTKNIGKSIINEPARQKRFGKKP